MSVLLSSLRIVPSALFRNLALTCCLLTASPAFGWWENGHRTVARLAAFHLTSAAQTRVAHILNVPDTPEAVADALALASTWADETKKETNTGEWHYIDLALQDSKGDIPLRCPGNNCLTARIHLFEVQLRSPASTPGRWSELDALRFLIHFIGDVEQPLHSSSDADLGGNCEHVDPPIDNAKNVHALWDGALVDALNKDDKQLAADLEKTLETYTPQLRSDLAAGNEDDWAWESHKLAIKDIYQRLNIPLEPVVFPANCTVAPPEIAVTLHIDSGYLDDMKPVVSEQLIKGGLRLARVLNELSSSEILQ